MYYYLNDCIKNVMMDKTTQYVYKNSEGGGGGDGEGGGVNQQ